MSETPTTTEPGIEMDDTDAKTIVVIGLVSTVLVLASALGVTALFDHWTSELAAERVVGAKYNQSVSALAAQDTVLYGDEKVIDPVAGVYSIKIDDAMALVVKEMSTAQQQATK